MNVFRGGSSALVLGDVTLVILTDEACGVQALPERTRVEYMLAGLGGAFSAVIVTGNNAGSYADLGVPVLEPEPPEAPLLGILRGALGRSRTSWSFCVSTSIPLVTPRVAEILRRRAGDFPGVQAVVPSVQRGLIPLASLYARSSFATVTGTLPVGEDGILDALADLRIALVEESSFNHSTDADELFLDVGRRKDLELIKARLRECPA